MSNQDFTTLIELLMVEEENVNLLPIKEITKDIRLFWDGVKGALLCTFNDKFSLGQFEDNDLPVLRRMLTWANYLGIKTYLPEIIHQAIVSVYAGNRKAVRIH